MGMMMLSPALISLPFKLMLFVLVDGWNLLLGSLAQSFRDLATTHDCHNTGHDIGQRASKMLLMVSAPLLLAALDRRPDRQRVPGRDADQRNDAVVHSEAGRHVRGAGDRRAVDAARCWSTTFSARCKRSRQPSADSAERAVLTFTDAQVLAWITPILWPMLRVLALFSALPVFGSAGSRCACASRSRCWSRCARRRRCAEMPVIPLDSGAVGAVVQQLVIGVSLGFAVRIVFVAVEFAGELIGLQMGLNFAGFFDP